MLSTRRFLVLCCLVLFVPGLVIADDAASREIVEKAIQKVGAEKLVKHKGWTSRLKGTIQVNGATIDFTGDLSSQGGNQQHISIALSVDGQSIAFASVLNRDQGWIKIADNSVDMTAEQLAESKESTYSGWVATLVPLRDKAFQLSPFGEIEIAGRKVVGINVTREGHRSVNLFFDKETLRLVRIESTVRDETTSKEVTEESNLSEYKDFDGVQHATKISIKRNGVSHADIEIENFKPVEKFDDSFFAKP